MAPRRSGIHVPEREEPPGAIQITANLNDVDPDNVAAVMVTTELPPFAVEGSRLDVTVSSIGRSEKPSGRNAASDGIARRGQSVYAFAQGAISIGGFVATGGAGPEGPK
jgi:flagellar P-ring protein precursor FlgI